MQKWNTPEQMQTEHKCGTRTGKEQTMFIPKDEVPDQMTEKKEIAGSQ